MSKSEQLIQGWVRDGLMTVVAIEPTIRDYDPAYLGWLRKCNAAQARLCLRLARADRLTGHRQAAIQHMIAAHFWIEGVRATA